MRRPLNMCLAALGMELLSVNFSAQTRSDAIGEPSQTGISNQPRFDGITVTVTGLKYPIGNAFGFHKKAFEAVTGTSLVFETVPFGDLYQLIETDDKSGKNRCDLKRPIALC